MPAQLPEFYAITAPFRAQDPHLPIFEHPAWPDWLDRFEGLLAGGIRLVQLRAKELQESQLQDLASRCQQIAAAHGVRLLLNGPAPMAERLGLAGIHLSSVALLALKGRPLPGKFLVGASCHSPSELAHAEAVGADFACLSPLKPTRGYGPDQVLGFERFAAWVAACRIPVYGLGGLGREDVDAVRKVGGWGVAGISAFWS